MPEYLTKEEVRQWRSSLERITLEEYAARLGKVVQGEKQTNDIVDKVMTQSLTKLDTKSYEIKSEKLQTIAIKSFEKEKEITNKEEKKVSQKPIEIKPKEQVAKKEVVKEVQKQVKQTSNDNVHLSFKKNLTPREQMIFDHFLEHKNSIVYAKDLAKILELPRDYVYKYIKNLRSKLNEEVLHNAENGGYILNA